MNLSKIDIPARVKSALDKLYEAGYEAYVVGGCVRDSLLGKEPHDWDIATSATPEEIQKVFSGYDQIDTGLKHGTVMVVFHNELIEITTYRIDDEYSDGRRPDKVFFTTSIIEDLARRDFSINACAMSDTQLIDPFGGWEDMKNRLIRCVGNPIERFTEDALRILRGIRFASVLDFEVDEETKKAMLECKSLLKNISQERITVEFCKTLLGIDVYDTLLEFKDVIAFILPEIEQMIGFDQNNKHHVYDVYQHTLKAVESIDGDIILRVTMFFHDIAKPACYSLDKNSNGHFYGHAEMSAQMAREILQRMRFSNRDIHDITELITYHDREIGLTSKSVKRLLSKLGETQFRRLLRVKRADDMAKNTLLIEEKLKTLDAIQGILDDLLASNPCIALDDLAIDGNDLMELGIPEGKQIGIILNQLLEMVLDEELENNRDVLIERAIVLGSKIIAKLDINCRKTLEIGN